MVFISILLVILALWIGITGTIPLMWYRIPFPVYGDLWLMRIAALVLFITGLLWEIWLLLLPIGLLVSFAFILIAIVREMTAMRSTWFRNPWSMFTL